MRLHELDKQDLTNIPIRIFETVCRPFDIKICYSGNVGRSTPACVI